MRTFSIGRSAACDIVLRDPTVSRTHAVLTVTGTGAYRFVDQASTSGSYRMHDGAWRAVTETELRADDRLRLGDHETTVAALLERAERPGPEPHGTATGGPSASAAPEEAQAEAAASRAHEPGDAPRRAPRTVVERDPATGRIVVRLR
ncbi:hypothetical protein VQ02_06775 [Methylobacterium variabile]|jgi:pSer/pThr/pTyr-binding forkhead associated (FHA) protein|uniref:FHA domain-containing protein n=1 Tax=Methylobacterium variabile TaxID=298794 RepID=A0A0J6VNU3_9HYPH|nr:FHA domain-containing protein [Methylobacterium variabile]KMO40876.1 hypothetical protein VQ02_06775 [Methylobacterium variabile]